MAEPTDEQLREAERQCYEECGRRGFAVSSRWVRERALRIAEAERVAGALALLDDYMEKGNADRITKAAYILRQLLEGKGT